MDQASLQNIKSKLKLYIINNNNKLNDTELADLFLKECPDVLLSNRTIRRYIGLVKKADTDLEEELNEIQTDTTIGADLDIDTVKMPIQSSVELIEDPKDRIFIFKSKSIDGDCVIDRITLDRLFCAYSRSGLNLTTGEIPNNLNLSPEVVRATIYKFNINKESSPYSPYSASILNDTELFNELNDNITFLMDSLKTTDNVVTSKLNSIYKKGILLNQNKDLKFKSLVLELKEALQKIKHEPICSINVDSKINTYTHNHTHLFIPDMHIGLEQANYNISIVREKLKYVLLSLQDCANIHVHFMGDIIHSVSGLNHKNAWRNMNAQMTGAAAIIEPYKLLFDFLSSISNLLSVDIVGGNHDRLASSNDEENTGEGAKLIAFMLNETLNGIPVIFDSYRIVDDSDPKMTVILLHGDKPIDKDSGQSIAWTHGNSKKFNYIMTAHMHSRKQIPKDDGLNFRKEALMAFCPMDLYSQTVANGSLPGFKLVSVDRFGLPVTLDMPLHYEKT